MQHMDILFDNYEDIFDQIASGLKIEFLSINAVRIDKFSINKLFFDVSQNHISISSLKIQNGFTD
jgi:hypothetical protein